MRFQSLRKLLSNMLQTPLKWLIILTFKMKVHQTKIISKKRNLNSKALLQKYWLQGKVVVGKTM
jgi:hypothetical protein